VITINLAKLYGAAFRNAASTEIPVKRFWRKGLLPPGHNMLPDRNFQLSQLTERSHQDELDSPMCRKPL